MLKMGNERREMGPVFLKFGVALALSFGGILYTFLKNKRIQSPRKSSGRGSWGSRSDHQASNSYHFDPLATDKNNNVHHPNNPTINLSPRKDAYLRPEFNELIREYDQPATKPNELHPPDTDPHSRIGKDTHEHEIKTLKNSIKILKERERNLEIQLLEYYGLKEQETAVMELQNRLKLNNMESKLFALKIESLQAENKRLQAQMGDYMKMAADLEAGRAKIKMLKKKLRSEAEQNKKTILDLQKRVEKMQDNEHRGLVRVDSEIERKLKDLEGEVEELRKSNHNLQMEKSDLARRFDCVQILATSVLEDGETEKLREENQNMKKQNEDLSKEIERMQEDRCADAEELVYLRWINACLRYELRNYQPRPGKTIARDLSKTLSPRSEEKAKQLILEYANKEGGEKGSNPPEIDSDQWSCSQASVVTDSGEFDESFMEESSSSPPRSKGNSKFFGKLRRVFRGGGDSHSHHNHHRRNHSRQSSVGRSESGGEEESPASQMGNSSENQRIRTSWGGLPKYSGDSQRPNRRHSDVCVYKQSGSSSSKSELVKYAEVLKHARLRTSTSLGSF